MLKKLGGSKAVKRNQHNSFEVMSKPTESMLFIYGEEKSQTFVPPNFPIDDPIFEKIHKKFEAYLESKKEGRA